MLENHRIYHFSKAQQYDILFLNLNGVGNRRLFDKKERCNMLIDYRYLQIITVQGGAETHTRHRFKHSGANNLCLFLEGTSAQQLFT